MTPHPHHLLPRLIRPLMLSLAIALPTLSVSQEIDAPPEIRALVEAAMPDTPTSPAGLREILGEALATEGYFSPEFEFSSDPAPPRLRITPGLRTLVTQVNLAVDGKIDPKTKKQLEDEWALPVGLPFRQADWNAAKHQVLSSLLADHYAAARLVDSEAAIDPETRSAVLTAHFDAGPSYRFGELRIQGLDRFDPALIARYNRDVQPGDPYSEARLNSLVAHLQATPYFSSVSAHIDPDAEPDAEGVVIAPVMLRVNERAPHRVSMGAGVSSNTGGRLELNYQTPNFLSRAWDFNTGLRIEQKQQAAYADVFLPPDAKNRRNSFGTIVENTDIQGLRTARQAFGAQTVQLRGSIEQRLSIHWQHERLEPDGLPATSSRALVPNVMWLWRQVDSLIAPQRGIVLQFQVGGGSKAALSDQDFVRLHGRWLQYIPLGKANTLTLRGEAGHTLASSRQHIPQDYVFRTGGTGSIRGYDYNSIGLREGGAVVGGRFMLTAGVEATHWLDESWGLAAFVDAGDAVDEPSKARMAVGYGFGGRWRSPAGPIGVDLAYGQRTGNIRLHFSLAIPF